MSRLSGGVYRIGSGFGGGWAPAAQQSGNDTDCQQQHQSSNQQHGSPYREGIVCYRPHGSNPDNQQIKSGRKIAQRGLGESGKIPLTDT